ncbi:hypothetical protein Angca_008236, partial [Angiostrongylus cantonensis]
WSEESVGESTVRTRFRKLRSGDFDLEGKGGRRRLNELDDDELKPLVEANKQATVQELAELLGVSRRAIPTHLNHIGKIKNLDKCVPHDLNDNRKKCRLEVSSALILPNKVAIFMIDHQMTGLRSGSTALPKAEIAPKKAMATVWWSAAELIHHSFLNPGEKITAEKYYQEVAEMHPRL